MLKILQGPLYCRGQGFFIFLQAELCDSMAPIIVQSLSRLFPIVGVNTERS